MNNDEKSIELQLSDTQVYLNRACCEEEGEDYDRAVLTFVNSIFAFDIMLLSVDDLRELAVFINEYADFLCTTSSNE